MITHFSEDTPNSPELLPSLIFMTDQDMEVRKCSMLM